MLNGPRTGGNLQMNTDCFEGQWRQMRGELRSWWGKLSDNGFEKIAGKKDRLVGMLQEKYGYTRDAAQQEIDRRFSEYNARTRAANSPHIAGKAEEDRNEPSAVQPMAAVG